MTTTPNGPYQQLHGHEYRADLLQNDDLDHAAHQLANHLTGA